MTFADRIVSLFGGSQKAAQLPVIGQSVASRAAVPSLQEFKLQIQEGLYKNSAVQGCVMALSGTMNEAPIIVTRPSGDYVDNHPIERLFQRPNPHMSGSQFWRYVTMYVYTGGNAYIHKVRSDLTGAVVELYPYHAGQMVPIPSQYGWIEGYNYMVDGVQRYVPAKDIIHIKWTPDPLNPTIGLSPIEIAGAKVQALNEIDQTIYSQMRNNGVPGHLMFLPTIPTEAQAEALRKMWADSFTGTGRGKLGVLSGEVRVERMAMNMAELQAEGLYGQLESAICGVYRVHPVVAMVYAGLLSSTYSNMETAFREFTTLTRVPTWKDWADQLTLGLREELGGLQCIFDTSQVESLKTDTDTANLIISQWSNNLITRNEARERLGLDPTDDGDQYQTDAVAPTGGFGFFDGVDDASTPSGPLEGEYDAKNARFVMAEDKAAAAWKQLDGINAKYAKEMEQYAAALFTDAAKQATSVKAGPDANRIDIQVLIDRFMRSSGALRRRLLDQIMAIAVQDVGADFSEVQSFVDEIEQQVTKQNIENISRASKTIKADVAKIISDNAGKSVADIAKAINEGVGKISEGRARTIAQTVVAQQTSTTQQATWQKMNTRRTPDRQVVKVWITQRDDEVRPSHEALDGKVVDAGNGFTDNIQAPGIAADPADFVNCRCIIRGVERRRTQ